MRANPPPTLTGEAYLTMDRAAEWKSEFHGGEMLPIEAVSFNHALVAVNVAASLKARLASIGCRALGSPLRVQVSPTQYVYPDFQIVCGRAELTDENADTLINPKVVIEILSRSTEGYDHGAKFELYRRLSSLEEYVLISQWKPMVEVFTKQSENSWSLTIAEGLQEQVRLRSVGIEFPLAELYEGVEWT
jgi:Uma2 family endonuclease